MFMHWLNYELICMIEISSSNILVYRHGGKFSPFVGARIVARIMQFIADSMVISSNAPSNIIGRGHVAALNEVFPCRPPNSRPKDKKCIGVLYEV